MLLTSRQVWGEALIGTSFNKLAKSKILQVVFSMKEIGRWLCGFNAHWTSMKTWVQIPRANVKPDAVPHLQSHYVWDEMEGKGSLCVQTETERQRD